MSRYGWKGSELTSYHPSETNNGRMLSITLLSSGSLANAKLRACKFTVYAGPVRRAPPGTHLLTSHPATLKFGYYMNLIIYQFTYTKRLLLYCRRYSLWLSNSIVTLTNLHFPRVLWPVTCSRKLALIPVRPFDILNVSIRLSATQLLKKNGTVHALSSHLSYFVDP